MTRYGPLRPENSSPAGWLEAEGLVLCVPMQHPQWSVVGLAGRGRAAGSGGAGLRQGGETGSLAGEPSERAGGKFLWSPTKDAALATLASLASRWNSKI